MLTPGQQHESTVVEAVPDACPIEAAVMDKAYDSEAIRARLRARRIRPVIPTRSHRRQQPGFDRELYRRRNCVERLVGHLKQFRAVATRYEKLACPFLALVQVVAAFLLARQFVNTA
ncbi:MAG: transposase [Gemmatales bacterium]|nr:transposase [Gemmatales bacterium]